MNTPGGGSMNQTKVKRKSPVDAFFALGDKVTGGDPKRKMDFDYSLMWVMLLAFCFIAYSNFMGFINTGSLASFGWFFVILAIIWFQFFTLKGFHEARKMMRQVDDASNFNEIQSVEDMDR